jgi:hypothetical protein
MWKNFSIIALILFASYVFWGLATNATAQPRNYTQLQIEQLASFTQDHRQELELLTNYARSHGITIREVVNDPKYYMDYQSNGFFQLHGMTEIEMMSNSARLDIQMEPKPWPLASKKQEIFEHCAEVLRSAVDTNQIEWVCSNMTTNLPAIREFQNQSAKDGPIIITFVTNEIVISQFRDFSRLAISNLDEFASLLTSPDLESYVGPGYCAKISNPTNFFFWLFWPDNLVRSIEKRTADGQHVIMEASFYENGRLAGFRVTSTSESITIDANGKMISYNGIENNMAIDLRPDETGNIKVRGFIINK